MLAERTRGRDESRSSSPPDPLPPFVVSGPATRGGRCETYREHETVERRGVGWGGVMWDRGMYRYGDDLSFSSLLLGWGDFSGLE